MLADTFGRPLRFRITPGQVSDIASAPDLLDGQQAGAVLADKAYDGNDLRDRIAGMDATAVIPSSRQNATARSQSRTTPTYTGIAIRSSDASAASNTSAASPLATTAAPFTSPASSISPPP